MKMLRFFRRASVLLAIIAMTALVTSSAQARFTSEKYPTSVTGVSTKSVMDAFGSTVQCTQTTYALKMAETSEDATVTPTFGGCVAFGLPMTAQNNSCDYVFHKPDGKAGTMDVVCTKEGDAIVVTVYSSSSHTSGICHVKFPAQTGKSGFTLTNSGPNIVLSGTISGLKATQTRTNFLCPAGTEDTSASYTIQPGGITLSGNNGAISVD